MPRFTTWGLMLAMLAVASKGLGFVRNALTAFFFGTSPEVNAFVIAKIVPLMVLHIFLGGAVLGSFVPALSRRLERDGEQEVWRFAISIGALVVGCGGVLTAGVVALAPWLVDLFGPGLGSQARTESIGMLRIVVLGLPFLTAATVITAILNSHDEFKAPGARPLAQNIGMVAALVAAGALIGADALVLGFLLGSILQLAIQIPALRRLAMRHRLRPCVRRADVREFAASYLPIFVTHMLLQSSLALDVAFASLVEPGGAAAVEYAEVFIDISRTIIGSTVAVVIFPYLSRVASKGEEDPVLVGRSLGAGILATVPLAAAYLCFGDAFIAVVLQRGSFGDAEARLVFAALFGLAPSVVLYAVLYVFDRLFIATGYLWTYTAILALGTAANVTAKLALAPLLGLTGVTAGTPIGGATSVIAAALVFHRLSKRSFFPTLLRDGAAIILGFGLGFAMALWMAHAVPIPDAVAPYAGLGWSTVGGLIGLGVIHVAKPPVYVAALELVRKRLRG